jgi:hypothetical protein
MDYKKKLLSCKPEERDTIKGKIEAVDDFIGCVNQIADSDEKINKLKAFFIREASDEILMQRILETTDYRLENKLIARIRHFNSMKKRFLADPHKMLKSL